jgi:hypothetical protein
MHVVLLRGMSSRNNNNNVPLQHVQQPMAPLATNVKDDVQVVHPVHDKPKEK